MRIFILAFATLCVAPAMAQPAAAREAPQTIPPTTAASADTGVLGLTPGALQLLTLDGEFSQAVSKGGGAAFVQWFADDAVTLSNGEQPVFNKAGIAAAAHWKPGEYKLEWQPMGAKMGAAGDMGFTWGHYDATTAAHDGKPAVVKSGRYITIWKKQPDGKWKVALDASADEPKG